MAEENGQGVLPRELYTTTMEMTDQRRLAIKRLTRARKLRAALTNRHPILPKEKEAYGYHSYGGDFGQNSHFDPISPTYNPRWIYHEDLTYGGDYYQASQCPQHYFEQSQTDLSSTLAKDWDKQQQDDEVFWREMKGLMSETGSAIQNLSAQPKYIHQSSDLGEEQALTDLVKAMAKEKVEAQQEMERFSMETRDTIQAMSTQIKHLTQSLVRIVKKDEEAPAQVYVQPSTQDDVVTLSHGVLLPKEAKMFDADEILSKDTDEAEEGKEDKVDEPAQEEQKKITLAKEAEMPKIRIQPPFPRRVARNMEAKEMSELLKVLKEENSGMFLIPCAIGNTKIESVMLNMEDSYNVMPLIMYQKLKIEPHKPTRAMIRLADMSRAQPVGIAEGVLVKVKDLILRADFYVLNVGRSQTRLGRPFLEAARDQIDCDADKPTYPVDEETVTFDLVKAEEQPPYLEDVHFENSPMV